MVVGQIHQAKQGSQSGLGQTPQRHNRARLYGSLARTAYAMPRQFSPEGRLRLARLLAGGHALMRHL